ncbi:MAG TPA: bifunctional 4-hydroxy-2-oxoglutarate aldolase/2-dehydro-3-deoxy-phosphogluconate aldolase [Acidobacteriota bacterium]|jgi:Entner-Doudoroff aldolase
MKPQEFVNFVSQEKASAIIRTSNQKTAASAMEAAIRGGFRIIEFTLTTPGALELISDFSKRDGIVVGAGTVLTVEDARKSVDAGASFLVSPVCDEVVIKEATKLDVASMPGCSTPTEMLAAHRAGAQLQKLFPAPAGGPAFVSSVLAPLPFLKIVPTNGIDENNVADYFRAGVFAVGFVKALFDPDDLRNERYDKIEQIAKKLKAAAKP